MNPLLSAAVSSILRHVLTLGAGFFVARGIWTPEEATNYTTAAAMFLVAIGWALWRNSRIHEVIAQALAMPSGSTFDELREKRKAIAARKRLG